MYSVAGGLVWLNVDVCANSGTMLAMVMPVE